ncbi:MAG: hypothetical protein EB066_00330 [Betaproteobacteria bacterium]|nr:hypothetical protein [Betaproteobacteria bacterium]
MQTMPLILPFFAARLMLISALAMCLASCGGGGGGDTNAQASNNGAGQDSGNATKFIPKPILTFSDTGLSVTDGVTRIGAWKVNGPEIWEFSFDLGRTWTPGRGDTFDVLGDGPKTIWVRARDNMGNSSEITMVNCVLDTVPPAPVQAVVMTQDLTRLVRVSGVEDQGQWEYSLDDTRTWLTGTGDRLAIMGNALTVLWLRQIDLAGNRSPLERVNLLEPNSATWHEASGNPLQPSVLSLQQARTVVLHGSVVAGDADYIRWDIPFGQSLKTVRLVHYVSSDPIAFYALQRAPVFDAGFDVSRMLVYGHMGPEDLKRNVLQNLAPGQLTAGPMTLWFQQTGVQPTEYAIELVFQPL